MADLSGWYSGMHFAQMGGKLYMDTATLLECRRPSQEPGGTAQVYIDHTGNRLKCMIWRDTEPPALRKFHGHMVEVATTREARSAIDRLLSVKLELIAAVGRLKGDRFDAGDGADDSPKAKAAVPPWV